MLAIVKRAVFAAMPVKQRFRRIYRLSATHWKSTESASGWGSTLATTESIRRELPALLRRLGIKSVVDVPCGDFNWMRHVIAPAGIERYVGLDIVPELIQENRDRYGSDRIEFAEYDLIRSAPPAADLVLMRDLLIHFSFADTQRALRNVGQSGAAWLLTTSHPEIAANADITTGRWRRINLERAPYGFPPPIEAIEDNEPGKILGLWRVSDIPAKAAAPVPGTAAG